MFNKPWKKTKRTLVVSTKSELKKAVQNKEPQIEVVGDLAKKVKWIAKLSPRKVMLLAGALAAIPGLSAISGPAAPITAGIAATTTVTAITGSEIALIIFTSGISISIIIAILRGYDVETDGGTVRFTYKR